MESSLIGKTLAHYEITGLLGKGGMGEVYRARDTSLGRDVALKILPPGIASDPVRVERFRREARTVAALKHPNIVTLYSAEEADGVQFLTMELIEGGSLTNTMLPDGVSLEAFFDLSIPLAQALNSAHEKGVTHRDLKPANIMLDEEGRPQILDFGLAQMVEEAAEGDATILIPAGLTTEGTIMGTVGYMSPEQAEGRTVDARSDIFSFGVILYQLATGCLPFEGETNARVISAILRDDPASVTALRDTLPHHLGRIVNRCLEKSPNDRYQTARDLHNELRDLREEVTVERLTGRSASRVAAEGRGRRVPLIAAAIVLVVVALAVVIGRRGFDGAGQPGPAAGPIRVVVLPMENLGDPDDEFFADGMTEEVTNRLAAVEGLGVISRKSALTYANRDISVQEIGSQLDVEYVLAGSVRWARSGDEVRVRVSPRLIRVADDTHLWASTYDRTFEDVFAIQTDIAKQVIRELGIALLDPDLRDIDAIPTTSPAAHEAYLRAMGQLNIYDQESVAAVVRLLEQAVELDPEFAIAYAELARVQASMIHFGTDVSSERLEAAGAAAARAIELAPNDVRSHIAMGFFQYHALKNYPEAERAFARAAELRPRDPELLRGLALVQRRHGQFRASTRNLEAAIVLNPRDINLILDLLDNYVSGARWRGSARYIELAMALSPDQSVIHTFEMISIWGQTGSTDGTREVLETASDRSDPGVSQYGCMLEIYEGNYDAALERIAESRSPVFVNGATTRTGAVWRGLIHQLAGNAEAARGNLEFAVSQFEGYVRDRPDGFRFESGLGIVYAALGRRDDARRQAERALEGFPLSRDTSWGPELEMDVATIYAMIGDHDQALEHAEIALSWPSYWTAARMGLDPWLNVVTGQPGFEAMRDRAEAKRAAMFD